MSTFVQFIRGKAAQDLIIDDPYAFSILAMVAQRARRLDDPLTGLKTGEAMIGRPEMTRSRFSISQQSYRTALRRLEKYGFVTTKPTKRGTIVKIIDSSIYNINQPTEQPAIQPITNQQVTNSQPTANQQPTTNNKDNKDNKEKNVNKYYDPDQIIPVINRNGDRVEGTIGKVLDGIFSRYPGNANSHDRDIVAKFLIENSDYPLSIAVSREVEQCENGVTPRNIRNFITNPPDKEQVWGWHERS